MRVGLFTILLILTIWSCGSRKVDKSESIHVIEQQSVKDVKNDLELSVNDSFVNRYVSKNSRFKADNVKVNVDGSIDIINPVVEAVEESVEFAGVRDSIVRDNGIVKSNESVSDTGMIKDKKIDREQFSWWGVLIPLGVVIVTVVVWRRITRVFY